MNIFDLKIKETGFYPLQAEDISTLQVNMGYKCNLACSHCHVEASPDRTEEMSPETVDTVLAILREHNQITAVDITGGSPELNPSFKHFVKSCAEMGKQVMVRSNLAVNTEPGMDNIPEFLAENKVKIIASLPCYTEEGVDSQRGKGTYHKAIKVLKKLNSLDYGNDGTGLEIEIMFNPAKEGIAPDQHMLQNAYKEKLNEMHGITFNNLIALSNMPIGRLGKSLSADEIKDYLNKLEESFNPAAVKNVMCRHLISVSPDGRLFDCDFWQMLNLSMRNGNSNRVDNFNYSELSKRKIVTNNLCLMCTAGAGASCSGALT